MKIFYFAFESIFDPVFDSQVVGFLSEMNNRAGSRKEKIKLVVAGSINDLSRKTYKEKKKGIKEKLDGNCIFALKFPYLYKFPRLLGFSMGANALICFFILFFILRLKKSEAAVCHCRTEIGAYILLKLKKLFYRNIKVIGDCRGIGSKEIMYKDRIGNRSLLSKKISMIEKYVHSNADYLFCVTKAFRKYILDEIKYEREKIAVIPCCLDVERFIYDPDLRKKVRDELGIGSENFAVLYSGSLNLWQLPGRMVEIFRMFKKVMGNCIFVVYTGDEKNACRFFKDSGLEKDSVIIDSIPYHSINKYLLAGDLGLLIREDNDVNRVAFPVKFSEYVRCGVPILTSIRSDVIDMVEDRGLGFRLKDFDDDKEIMQIAEHIRDNMARIKSDEYKSGISGIIREKVDWDSYTDSVWRIYRDLASGK